MSLYRNKYRSGSARLKGWDYRNAGSYFITICTKNRTHFLGECKDGKMYLSGMGAIVWDCWYDIPQHFSNAALDVFQVMPNHMHGIIFLDGTLPLRNGDADALQCNASASPSILIPEIPPKKNEFFQKISPKPGTVSTIIRSFKSVCSKNIHLSFSNISFAWQDRFHDHIIRNKEEHYRIRNYILNNPANWKDDTFYIG